MVIQHTYYIKGQVISNKGEAQST